MIVEGQTQDFGICWVGDTENALMAHVQWKQALASALVSHHNGPPPRRGWHCPQLCQHHCWKGVTDLFLNPRGRAMEGMVLVGWLVAKRSALEHWRPGVHSQPQFTDLCLVLIDRA